MKLAWLTDIHLNFLTGKEQTCFLESIRDQADSFVISGDIADGLSICSTLRLIDRIVDKPVYFVLGNHDFYRGFSISQTRSAVCEVVLDSKNLIYLSDTGAIDIMPRVSLVGHDGWADTRFGNYSKTNVVLNDFHLIPDFYNLTKIRAQEVMQRLAYDAAKHIEINIPDREVIIVTHVPPFQTAAWHEGRQCSDDYLPFFSSKIMGDMLLTKSNKMTVLCGHTHGGGKVKVSENLVVLTGHASYGKPEIQKIFNLTKPESEV
jgi:Icc-related predicted phosphoesterase